VKQCPPPNFLFYRLGKRGGGKRKWVVEEATLQLYVFLFALGCWGSLARVCWRPPPRFARYCVYWSVFVWEVFRCFDMAFAKRSCGLVVPFSSLLCACEKGGFPARAALWATRNAIVGSEVWLVQLLDGRLLVYLCDVTRVWRMEMLEDQPTGNVLLDKRARGCRSWHIV